MDNICENCTHRVVCRYREPCGECNQFATDNNVGHKWIPVTERLPDKTGLYVGYDSTYGILLVYYSTDRMMTTWETITHWMPLPEPPKP